jgi:hypothetical protein
MYGGHARFRFAGAASPLGPGRQDLLASPGPRPADPLVAAMLCSPLGPGPQALLVSPGLHAADRLATAMLFSPHAGDADML